MLGTTAGQGLTASKAAPLPSGMPARKPDVVRQQVLGSLIETKPVSWSKKTIDPESPDPKKPDVIRTKVTGTELRYPLARNVTELSVERYAGAA